MNGKFEFIRPDHFQGEYVYIPERMRDGMVRYVNQGIKPGHFLVAVIENDLKGAVARADDENMQLIPLYVRWFYNQAPAPCWGSPAKMKSWMEEREASNE